jgi:hypothetical protein
MEALPSGEQDYLLTQGLRLFERYGNQRGFDLDLARTQIERLPPPPKKTEAEALLMKWVDALETPSGTRLIGIRKLVVQDLNPDPKVFHSFKASLLSSNCPPEWIAEIPNIRSPERRSEVITHLALNFSKIDKSQQPYFIWLLAKNLSVIPDQYKKIRSLSASLIKSKDRKSIEFGLRAMISIIQYQRLNEDEAQKLKTWLNSIPEANQTPMAKESIHVLLVKIGGESN